jgi:hypothetical protein
MPHRRAHKPHEGVMTPFVRCLRKGKQPIRLAAMWKRKNGPHLAKVHPRFSHNAMLPNLPMKSIVSPARIVLTIPPRNFLKT